MSQPDTSMTPFAVGEPQSMTRAPSPTLFENVAAAQSAADIGFSDWPSARAADDTGPVDAHIGDDLDKADLLPPDSTDAIRRMGLAGIVGAGGRAAV